jgi:hypothetical protein
VTEGRSDTFEASQDERKEYYLLLRRCYEPPIKLSSLGSARPTSVGEGAHARGTGGGSVLFR